MDRLHDHSRSFYHGGVYGVYYATGYANSTPSTVGELSSKIVASVRVDGYTKDTFVNDDFGRFGALFGRKPESCWYR